MLRLIHFNQRDDVRMAKRGDNLGLAEKTQAALVVADDVRGQDFDGDFALRKGVSRFIHNPHAAAPKLFKQRVAILRRHAPRGLPLVRRAVSARQRGVAHSLPRGG